MTSLFGFRPSVRNLAQLFYIYFTLQEESLHYKAEIEENPWLSLNFKVMFVFMIEGDCHTNARSSFNTSLPEKFEPNTESSNKTIWTGNTIRLMSRQTYFSPNSMNRGKVSTKKQLSV